MVTFALNLVSVIFGLTGIGLGLFFTTHLFATHVTATVTSQTLHRARWLTHDNVTLDNSTFAESGWGADVTFSWGAAANCTITEMYTERFNQTELLTHLIKAFAVGTTVDLFLMAGGLCYLSDVTWESIWIIAWGLMVIFILCGGLVVVAGWNMMTILWVWYGTAVKACWHRWWPLLSGGGGGGGSTTTDKKTDEPLVNSAPLP